MSILSKLIRLFFATAVLAIAGFYWLTIPNPLENEILPEHQADLKNGELMFWAGGCGSCHAAEKAKGEAKKKLGGGLKLKTDFGTFVVPNISPDKEFGIGNWSNLDFVNAMKLGIAPGGKHLYPAFPYTSYQRMTLTDVLDLKAYLDTLPSINNQVSENELKFPFNIRRGLGIWKHLYLDGEPFVRDNNLSELGNLGKYLVEGAAHCGECHTPRNILGAMERKKSLAGAVATEGEGFVPNITPSRDGIGDWSTEDIAYSMESGFTPEYDSFGGSMVSVQDNMAHLPDEYRLAIATYLRSVPPHQSNQR